MAIRLVAFDLDGTLIDDRLTVSERLRRAVARARAAGIQVTLATGRTWTATRPFVEALGIDVPVLCYQGGAIVDPRTGRWLLHRALPPERVRAALLRVRSLGPEPLLFLDDRIYVRAPCLSLILYRRYSPELPWRPVGEPAAFLRALGRGPTKVVFADVSPQRLQALRRGLRSTAGGWARVLRSHRFFLELLPQDVDKGTGLAELARLLGVSREAVAAVGDQENDLPMLRWAGLGLAVANAVPACRQAADQILPPPWEEGPARWLEALVEGSG